MLMKKIIALTIAIILSNCEIKVRETTAQSVYATHVSYDYKEVVIKNMTYGIWIANYNSGPESAIFVVNLTKDALEIELLRKQLNNK